MAFEDKMDQLKTSMNSKPVANASEFLVSNGNSGKIPLEAETINEKPFN